MNKTRAFAAIALSAATLLALAPSASASGDGVCHTDRDACFFYNSDLKGAKVDIDDCWSYNHVNFKFIGPGNGAGITLKNNAASVQNWSHYNPHFVYYNSNLQGPRQQINPWSWSNLNSTLKNNNASSVFYETGNC
ncbi:hypothetical protein [Streptomyces viridosporus]|uniref:hypothetical protein n=1 Tax=Streptomyces viridosporus TaxID=67581 RepID=UPI001180F6AA|nr:hypothetical protein [Streptomyces viridosporus]